MINVRAFNIRDIDECVKLFLEVFSAEPWNDKWPNYETAKAYISEFVDNPSFVGFISEDDNEIVGACFGHKRSWWQGKEYLIEEFFIETKKQGKGIGSKMVNYIKCYLQKEDIKNIILLTGRDTDAYKFYKKHGFQEKESIAFMYTEA